MYPLLMVGEYYNADSPIFFTLAFCELIFAIDMIMSFFKQELDEAGVAQK